MSGVVGCSRCWWALIRDWLTQQRLCGERERWARQVGQAELHGMGARGREGRCVHLWGAVRTASAMTAWRKGRKLRGGGDALWVCQGSGPGRAASLGLGVWLSVVVLCEAGRR